MFDFIAGNAATVNFVLIDVALALSIYVTLACGLLSLANAGFLAIGAYTAGFMQLHGVPFFVYFPLAAVLAEFMVGLTGWELARVVIPESSQPFTRYLANAELLLVMVGFQTQLMEAR